MFYATILACTLINPNACIEADDTRGPYKTREECVLRVEEMIADSVTLLPAIPHSFRFRCQPKRTPTWSIPERVKTKMKEEGLVWR